jgi:hypothetical protein
MVKYIDPLHLEDSDTTLMTTQVDDDQVNLQLEGPYESSFHTIEMDRDMAQQLLVWLIAFIAGDQ